MKHLKFATLGFLLFVLSTGIFAQDRRFGLGIIIGEPTGLSAKLWVTPVNAFDFGLGWSVGGDRLYKYDGGYNGDSRVHFHMDYLWHWFSAIQSSNRFPLYTGLGGRVNSGGGYSTSVAARGVLGIAWIPDQAPIDIFVEIVPSLQLVPGTGFGMDAGFGGRFYF